MRFYEAFGTIFIKIREFVIKHIFFIIFRKISAKDPQKATEINRRFGDIEELGKKRNVELFSEVINVAANALKNCEDCENEVYWLKCANCTDKKICFKPKPKKPTPSEPNLCESCAETDDSCRVHAKGTTKCGICILKECSECLNAMRCIPFECEVFNRLYIKREEKKGGE